MRHLPGQRNNINALTMVSGDSKCLAITEIKCLLTFQAALNNDQKRRST